MSNDESMMDNGLNGPSSMALLSAGALERRPVDWNNAALVQAAPVQESSGSDVFTYLHGLRRHWVLITALGILFAGITGPAVWFLVGTKYVASSYIQIAMQDQSILNATRGETIDKEYYETFKNTQRQSVLSRYVLMAALRKPEVSKLPAVEKASREGDVVLWLMDWLSVNFPGRGEFMEISVTRYDPKEAAALARAVTDAYLNEVVNDERTTKRKHLDELDRVYVSKENDIRGKREELKTLAKTLGISDADNLNVQQRISLELLSMYRHEAAGLQGEIRKIQSELAAQNAMLKGLENIQINDAEVEMMVLNDPIAKQLFMELGFRKMQQIYTEGAVVPEAKSSYADRYQQDLAIMQQQYDERRAELADIVKQQKIGEVKMQIEQLSAAMTVITADLKEAIELVEKQQAEAEKFGISSVEVEMLRSEIENLDQSLASITQEREKLKVEINSMPRITLRQRADDPIEASNRTPRIALTIIASLFAFCCPAVGIVLMDYQTKRINNSVDVSQKLGLSVIGSMPLIPARVIRRLGAPTKKSQVWHMRLTESVDGIAARVLRKAETEQCRVVMVSSAVGGEGKTTLATQLAMSLARAGRRTVLVDFDLRRPAFDEVFGLSLEPGVCEALRRQNAVSALVHDVGTENLAVVTAGRWDRTALASLSNGAAASMFKQLREDFEFVVVDTSPILPVADARFVSQHVDSVVLSIFRDISEAPKIEAACEILSAFGVQAIEAVVTGSNDRMYGKHMGYESTISA